MAENIRVHPLALTNRYQMAGGSLAYDDDDDNDDDNDDDDGDEDHNNYNNDNDYDDDGDADASRKKSSALSEVGETYREHSFLHSYIHRV